MTLINILVLAFIAAIFSLVFAACLRLGQPMTIQLIYPEQKATEYKLSEEDKKYLEDQQRILDAAVALQDLFGVSSKEDEQ